MVYVDFMDIDGGFYEMLYIYTMWFEDGIGFILVFGHLHNSKFIPHSLRKCTYLKVVHISQSIGKNIFGLFLHARVSFWHAMLNIFEHPLLSTLLELLFTWYDFWTLHVDIILATGEYHDSLLTWRFTFHHLWRPLSWDMDMMLSWRPYWKNYGHFYRDRPLLGGYFTSSMRSFHIWRLDIG